MCIGEEVLRCTKGGRMTTQVKRLLFIAATIFAAPFISLLGNPTVAAAENLWMTPNRSTFPFSVEEYAELDSMMEPCAEHARETFSEAARRHNEEMESAATFYVMSRTPGPDDHPPNFYVQVKKVDGIKIQGSIASNGVVLSGRRYRRGKKFTLPVSDIVDWLVIYPDRPEVGNLLGKYMLLRQDGLVSGPCDPLHSEFQHFRLFREDYSFVPPSGSTWRLYGPSLEGDVTTDMTMQEHGSGPDEANTIYVVRYEVPIFSTDQELVDLTIETEKKNLGDPNRYTLREHEVIAYRENNARCALSRQISDDNAALKRTGERTPMIREIMSLVCVYPSKTDMAINLTYSHRYHDGHRDPEFTEKATAVFQSLAFSKLE